ncbi:TonB-dependent siderophore receptor [Fulvimarina endophytica]|uniref:TonB-dependent siderophore receptor n=1 Tax=Fulvimarina endophytica TaxID=2293836 RepID=A0A371X9W9_9HYPH|nr:TonB-dependent siderophore receptor [Fulvimarina endophytica]RFC66006.1 TonB-dependent siderophore receptor [Fulvimarina endophytica]
MSDRGIAERKGIWTASADRRTKQIAAVLLGSTIVAHGALGIPLIDRASAQEAAQAVRFSIPAQPLSSAVDAFSRATGWQVGYPSDIARSTTSRAVSGTMTPGEALRRMVAGTEVGVSVTGPTSAALVSSAAAEDGAIAEDGSVMLDMVTVEGQGETTEGTGAYTTPQMGTAVGLPLSIKETPQSVSVVTRQRLEDQRLDSTADVLKTTTGIQVQEWDSQRTEPFSRGFYLNTFQYDGVPVNNLDAMYGEHRSDTLQYDHVEVLRGASGLLTGTGNPSGAINFVRKHADSRVLTGEVTTSYGSWNDFRETLDVTTPLSGDGSVRGRFIGSFNDRESFRDREDSASGLLYGIIDADLTPDTRLSVGAEHQRRELNDNIWSGLLPYFSDGTRTDFSRSFNTAPDWAFWDTENTTVFGSLEHRFDNDWVVDVDATHLMREGEAKLLYVSGQPDPITGAGAEPWPAWFHHEAAQTVLSAKITGPYELFGRQHEFFSGVLYDHTHEDYIYHGATNFAPIESIFDWSPASYPEPEWAKGSLRVQKIEQKGAYAATRISLTDALNVIGGLRYTQYDTWQDRRSVVSEQSDGRATPYIGATYDLNETYSLYASYTSVFRLQNERDIRDDFLEPVTGSNTEAGVKGSWFDERLNASVAVFRTLEDNVAIATGERIPGTTQFAYRPGQGIETKGVEGEVSGELLPGWNLTLGGTYFESRDGEGVEVNTTLPRSIVRLFTTYTPEGNWSNLTIGGGVNWQGETYLPITTAAGTSRLTQSDYATVSLMARYDFNETFSGQLNVENLFDKKFVQILEGDEQISFGAPRRALFRLSAKF